MFTPFEDSGCFKMEIALAPLEFKSMAGQNLTPAITI